MAVMPAVAGGPVIDAAAEVWAPRTVLRLGHWQAGPACLKAYGILADAAPPLAPASVAAARALVEGHGAAIAATDHRGVGFVILHRGAESLWLLLHWWVAGGVCAQMLWRGRLDGAAAFEALDRPLMACVWELALIDHERRAYVRSVMARSGDAEAYLADIYRQDFC